MPTEPQTPTTPQWSSEQREALAVWMREPWRYRATRRLPLRRKLTDEQIAAAGERIAEIDADLVVKRQHKNAEQARLMREKKSREGALTSLATRVIAKADELGRPLTPANSADYARKMAALREEYDAFEVERKAHLQVIKEDLAALEDEQKKISAKVSVGTGDVMVAVVDFADYQRAVVVTVELETGNQIHERSLDEHEAQIGLFSGDEHPAMSPHEWTLAIGGRLRDAARAYVGRTGLAIDEAAAVKILRHMLPDEELPPDEADVKNAPDADEPAAPSDIRMFVVTLTDRTGKSTALYSALLANVPGLAELEAKGIVKGLRTGAKYVVGKVQGEQRAAELVDKFRAVGGVMEVVEQVPPPNTDDELPPEPAPDAPTPPRTGKDAAAGADS